VGDRSKGAVLNFKLPECFLKWWVCVARFAGSKYASAALLGFRFAPPQAKFGRQLRWLLNYDSGS
jgi:hypothetical protein